MGSLIKKFNLTFKISLFFVLLLSLSLITVGFYFDRFLENNFLQNSKKQIYHAFSQLKFTIDNTESKLKQSLAFSAQNQMMTATLGLIRSYEDPDHYNTILFDEEKKNSAQQLLSQIRAAFLDRAVIYDFEGKMVAFAYKNNDTSFALGYTSYSNSEKKVMIKVGDEALFRTATTEEIQNLFDHSEIHSFQEHTDSADYDESIPYHNSSGHLLIEQYDGLYNKNRDLIGHIEISKIVLPSFLKNLSDVMNVSLRYYSAKPQKVLMLNDIKRLGQDESIIKISEKNNRIISILGIKTQEDTLYFASTLELKGLKSSLLEHQTHFFSILAIIAMVALLAVFLFIKRTLTLPLAHIMRQIGSVKRYDYAKSDILRRKDELGVISANIVDLATAVEEREASLMMSQDELEYLSDHDVLTALPNRRFYSQRLEYAIAHAKRSQTMLAVLFLDLDDFKSVNDTLGHNIGDILLQQVAKRLSTQLRSTDTLSRIGGDEFNILIEDLRSVEQLEPTLEKVLASFEEVFHCNDYEISTKVSIGISIFPQDGVDVITLIKHADLAMYKAKSLGSGFSFYLTELSDLVMQRAQKIRSLKEGLIKGGEFELHYQPKVAVADGSIVAVEALIRWNSLDYGFVRPDLFIPLAEEHNLIIPIGKWVLRQACEDFIAMQRAGVVLDHISVNVSSVQLLKSDMGATIDEVLAQTGMDPKQLEIEITESYIATNAGEALRTLKALRDKGIRIAVDDFGTGYSSLSYLKLLPISRIKIDKVFVDGIPDCEDDNEIVKAIIALAKSLKLSITAEGVEQKAQWDFLAGYECDEIQGFYFYKPLDFKTLIAVGTQNRSS